MTEPVARSGAFTRNTNLAGADFQSAIRRAVSARGAYGNGGGSYASRAGGPPHPGGVPTAVYPGGPAPVSDATRSLIDAAILYDTQAGADPKKSQENWDRVRTAIAGEIRVLLPDTQPTESDQTAASGEEEPLPAELVNKVYSLSVWVSGNDTLKRETNKAIAEIDAELVRGAREQFLDDTIAKVKLALDGVEDKNADENPIRQLWDGVTGGGAGEDFEGFLRGKLEKLQALDDRDETLTNEQYAQEVKNIMGDFEVQFTKHLKSIEESDETWHTVGEVGRVVAATTVGILATAASGGNAAVGFGAALLTYEVIDAGNDAWAAHRGQDAYADGHASLFTGLADQVFGNGVTKEQWDVLWKDTVIDGISSVTVGGATWGGMKMASLTGAKFLPANFVKAHPVWSRVAATTAGGTTAQVGNSIGAVGSDAARLQFEGKLTGGAVWDSTKAQLPYAATAIPAAAIAGWIPIYRALPAGATAAGATAPAQQFNLNWVGLSGQFVNDGAWSFASAYAADGEITQGDAIAALGSTVPGVTQNVVLRPDSQGHAVIWHPFRKSGSPGDLHLLPTGLPRPIRLAPIATTVAALRGLIAAAGQTSIANAAAPVITAARSSVSKFFWFKGNWGLIRAYELALQGDKDGALNHFDAIAGKRRTYGISRTEGPGEAPPGRAQLELLADLGVAYRRAREHLPEDQRGSLPPLKIRDLATPDEILTRLKADPNLPPEVRTALAGFNPETRPLQYSNIVEGLLTDPEFVANAIGALKNRKLSTSELADLRELLKVERLLHADYSGVTPTATRTVWDTILGRETGRLRGELDPLIAKVSDPAVQGQLRLLGDAWRAYAVLHSQSRYDLLTGGSTGSAGKLQNLRAAYTRAREDPALDPEFRKLLPTAGDANRTRPEEFFTRLKGDSATPQPVKDVLGEFKPDMYLLNRPFLVKQILDDPQHVTKKIDGLDGKLKGNNLDNIKLIRNVETLLRQDRQHGGYHYLMPGSRWNEATWRKTGNENPAVMVQELKRIKLVENLLMTTVTDPVHRRELKHLIDAWTKYTKLYGQMQHEMPNSPYAPGIKYKGAEQVLGSSASPDTGRGFLLKAAAFGAAVHLFVSWAQRSFPEQAGTLQVLLWGAYGAEFIFGAYNFVGQGFYLRALGKMTLFKDTHEQAQYRPSDKREDMAKFEETLATAFKKIEAFRDRMNKVSDGGSFISAFRNLLMAVAFFKVGLWEVSIPLVLNAAASVGWLTAQRPEWFNKLNMNLEQFWLNHPDKKMKVRWASIGGGTLLQALAFGLALLNADEMKKITGGDNSVFNEFQEWLEGLMDDIVTNGDPTLPLDHRPLPDRA
jgi:hypothetical protein